MMILFISILFFTMPDLNFTCSYHVLPLENFPPDYTEFPVFSNFIGIDIQRITNPGASQDLQILCAQEKTLESVAVVP